jgi:transposase
VEAELKVDPDRSYRAIAEKTGTSHHFVKKISDTVMGGNVPTPSERKSRNGKVGEGQKKEMIQATAGRAGVVVLR